MISDEKLNQLQQEKQQLIQKLETWNTEENQKALKNLNERIRYRTKQLTEGKEMAKTTEPKTSKAAKGDLTEQAVAAISKLIEGNKQRQWLCGRAYHVFRKRWVQ